MEGRYDMPTGKSYTHGIKCYCTDLKGQMLCSSHIGYMNRTPTKDNTVSEP